MEVFANCRNALIISHLRMKEEKTFARRSRRCTQMKKLFFCVVCICVNLRQSAGNSELGCGGPRWGGGEDCRKCVMPADCTPSELQLGANSAEIPPHCA
jgi:hypothetical protein